MTTGEYNIVVENVSSKLFSYIKKSTRDADLSNDLVQESYARLWENHKKIKIEQAEKWLFTTAYRAMLNWIKKNKRSEKWDESFNLYDEPLAQEDNFEVKEWLDKGLEQLTENQRQIILLRDMQGYSYKSIEEITGLQESQVKVYLFRARKKLKEILSNLILE